MYLFINGEREYVCNKADVLEQLISFIQLSDDKLDNLYKQLTKMELGKRYDVEGLPGVSIVKFDEQSITLRIN